jgi:hypothetical protein
MLRAWRYRKNYFSGRELGLDIEYSLFKAAGVCLVLLLIPAFVSVRQHARSWQAKEKAGWQRLTASVVARGPYQTENPDITFRVDTVEYPNPFNPDKSAHWDFKLPFNVSVGTNEPIEVKKIPATKGTAPTWVTWMQADLDQRGNDPLKPGVIGQVTKYTLSWLVVFVLAFVAVGFAWHFFTISRRVHKQRVDLAIA